MPSNFLANVAEARLSDFQLISLRSQTLLHPSLGREFHSFYRFRFFRTGGVNECDQRKQVLPVLLRDWYIACCDALMPCTSAEQVCGGGFCPLCNALSQPATCGNLHFASRVTQANNILPLKT